MFICHGDVGERVECRLSRDKKPLLIFQKFKMEKRNPVFALKRIADVHSLIATTH